MGGASYCYDRNGNLTSGGGRTYSWDAANRISSVSQTSGTESYTYDGDGERVKTVRGATTTVYFNGIWEAVVGGGTKAYYQFNGQVVALGGAAAKRTMHSAGRPWRCGPGGSFTYLHSDRLGSASCIH